MIVDQAEADMEMSQDPFLEAGIDIPTELPHGDSPAIAQSMKIKHGGIFGRSNSKQVETPPQDMKEGNEIGETNGLICLTEINEK